MPETSLLVYLGHYLWMGFLLAAMMVISAPRVLLRSGKGNLQVRFHFAHGNLLFVGVFLLFLWFAGLAITAGPAPIIERGDAASYLRILESSAALVCWIWLVFTVRSQVKATHPSINASGPGVEAT